MATVQEIDENTLIFTRQLAGAEDLVFGFGSTSQIREGNNVTVTLINSGVIPYDSTRTVKQALDELFASVQGN
jgi:hypothetical protein